MRNARFLIRVELPAGTLYVSRIRVFEIPLSKKGIGRQTIFSGAACMNSLATVVA